MSSVPLLVRLFCPLPLASMTKISWFPSRFDMKAMRVPSGDQVGQESSPLLVVKQVIPLPSAFITQIRA